MLLCTICVGAARPQSGRRVALLCGSYARSSFSARCSLVVDALGQWNSRYLRASAFREAGDSGSLPFGTGGSFEAAFEASVRDGRSS